MGKSGKDARLCGVRAPMLVSRRKEDAKRLDETFVLWTGFPVAIDAQTGTGPEEEDAWP